MANLAQKIILETVKEWPIGEGDFDVIKRKFTKLKIKGSLPGKTALLKEYHKLIKLGRIKKNTGLEELLIKRAVRTMSGVTIITSLTKPYACPGNCVYCPYDEKMPKSYLAEEPAAARALALKFDPYRQMTKRMEALEKNGHPTEKIELIIKGGSWNAYPLSYQFWFILRSFQAANESKRTLSEKTSLEKLRKALATEQNKNENAKHRIIGLTLETRPDCITEKSMWEMREMGVTRVELGVQSTNEEILKKIKRGHGAVESVRAIRALKNFGYKTDIHLMPQLPGATSESDTEMLNEIFDNPDYRPDMIKIYPCTVVKNSELYGWYRKGIYHAYPVEKLVDVIKKFKVRVPRYTRISRLIRDIPGQYIEEGNKMTNLRQVIQAEMERDGLRCQCLRCREIGHVDMKLINKKNIESIKQKLFIEKYEASGGTEYFLSFEDPQRQVVFAFCRLRLNTDNTAPFPAYIRELHTYGQSLELGEKNIKDSQHKGLGKQLIEEVEKICRKNSISELAVISGIGVREYYRKLGYDLKKTYLVKKLI